MHPPRRSERAAKISAVCSCTPTRAQIDGGPASPSQFAAIILARTEPRCANRCSSQPVNFLSSFFEPFLDCAAARAGSDSNFDVSVRTARAVATARAGEHSASFGCAAAAAEAAADSTTCNDSPDIAGSTRRPAKVDWRSKSFAGPLPKPRIAARWSPLHTSGTASRRGLGVGGCSSPPPVPHGTGAIANRRSPHWNYPPQPPVPVSSMSRLAMGDHSWAPLRDPLLAQPPRDPSSSPHDPQRGREGGREGRRKGGTEGRREAERGAGL